MITRTVLLATLALVFTATPSRAQFPPDSLTNLKVFPKDIGVRELIGNMRNFALGLGVRCQFCHVGEDGMPLAEFDFASDDKVTKRKAREMLRMVQAINNQHLTNLEERSDPPVEVTCETCHHGLTPPRTLEADIMEVYADSGIDVAIQKYRDLRERYYGSYSYDFTPFRLVMIAEQVVGMGNRGDALQLLALNVEMSPDDLFAQRSFVMLSLEHTIVEQGTDAALARYHELKSQHAPAAFVEQMLNALGYRLLRQRHMQEAIAIFKLNVEAYPDAFNTYDSLGEAYMMNGDLELAIQNYEKSVELNPENTSAVERLKQLRSRLENRN